MLAAAALLLAGGCFTPDYPDTYRCSPTDRRCPEGTSCQANVCLPDEKKLEAGVDKKVPDQGKPDHRPGLDRQVVKPDQGPQPDKQVVKPDQGQGPDKQVVKPDQGQGPDKQVVKPDQGQGADKGACAAAQCSIGNKCFKDRQTNPQNKCQRCLVDIDPFAWMPNCVTTLVGTGTKGFMDNLTGTQAQLNDPKHVAVTGSGNQARIYITDTMNRRLRLLDRSTGKVTTAAGDGTMGNKVGPAAQAQFMNLEGVAAGSGGAVYFLDYSTRQLNKLDAGYVSVVATLPVNPVGLDFSTSGGLPTFYVATGFSGHRIYRVDSAGSCTVHAGTGSQGDTNGPLLQACFYNPGDVAVLPGGGLVVADSSNYRVRKVSATQVANFAGTGVYGFQEGGDLSSGIGAPYGIAADSSGRVFLSDTTNCAVRVIHNGKLVTLAGKGPKSANGCGDTDGDSSVAMLDNPYGVDVDAAGIVYFVDRFNHKVKMIHAGP